MDLVTPEVRAKHDLLFNKPASGWYFLKMIVLKGGVPYLITVTLKKTSSIYD